MAVMDKARVLVGIFGAPHGVRGQIRLKSFTGVPEAIAGYGALGDAAGSRRFVVTALRLLKGDMFVATLEGVDQREAAVALNGVELFVPRAALPVADAEEFYHADLIGLRAEAVDGALLGTVRNVLNFGAGDILEIAPAAGGEMLVLPFTKAVVPVIDVAGGRLVVALRGHDTNCIISSTMLPSRHGTPLPHDPSHSHHGFVQLVRCPRNTC